MRDKLIELLMNIPQVNHAEAAVQGLEYVFGCAADYLIANGVTIATDNNVGDKVSPTDKDINVPSKWISVKERLPEMRDDGFADAFLVTDGSLAHIAYFVDGNWIFTDNGQMKEPMFYDVTHWLCLPQPPKGE